LLKSTSFSEIASELPDLAKIHSSRADTCVLASSQLPGRVGPEHSHLSPLAYLHPSICGDNEGATMFCSHLWSGWLEGYCSTNPITYFP